jgi:hypothetical protein
MMRNTTAPLTKAKQSKVCSALYSPLTSFMFGILFGFSFGFAYAYVEYGIFVRVTVSDSNFTRMKYEHFELTLGITQFLQLAEGTDELLSHYVEDIIHQLSNSIQKGITDLKDLQESTKPKIRRRPPLEEWNSNTTT